MKNLYTENYKIVKINNNDTMILHVPTMNLIYQKAATINYKKIESKLSDLTDVKHKLFINSDNDVNQLSGLILNTTESCNLACEYCMVSKGTYHNNDSKKSMNIEDYKKIFCFMFENYKHGSSFICFFGGEPLLKFPVVKEAIKLLFQMYDERELQHPRCSIITNGVLLDEEVVNFLNEYGIFLSISIDGIDKFHDAARVFPNGQGSYKIIKHNLLRLKDVKRKFPMYAEATIHKQHLIICEGNERNAGYNFVSNIYQLGFDSVYVFPVDSKDEEISIDHPKYYRQLELFYNGIYDYYMELFFKEEITELPPGHFVGVFGNIFMKRANRFCQTGKSTLFVNPKGELYPCHLLYNSMYMKLGDLKTGYDKAYNNKKRLINNRYDIEKCQKCSNRNLCFLWCPGSSILSNGEILSTINTRCMLVDITVNYIIKEIANLLSNPERYHTFKNNLIKISQNYKPNKF